MYRLISSKYSHVSKMWERYLYFTGQRPITSPLVLNISTFLEIPEDLPISLGIHRVPYEFTLSEEWPLAFFGPQTLATFLMQFTPGVNVRQYSSELIIQACDEHQTQYQSAFNFFFWH